MEEQIVRAERDALVAETERLAAIEREGAASAVPTSGPGAPTGTSSLSLFRPLTQARPPKFDNVPEHYAMWRSKFGAYISSLGHLHVLNATVPVMVGDISVSQEELTNRHTKDEISEARLVYSQSVRARGPTAAAAAAVESSPPPPLAVTPRGSTICGQTRDRMEKEGHVSPAPAPGVGYALILAPGASYAEACADKYSLLPDDRGV